MSCPVLLQNVQHVLAEVESTPREHFYVLMSDN